MRSASPVRPGYRRLVTGWVIPCLVLVLTYAACPLAANPLPEVAEGLVAEPLPIAANVRTFTWDATGALWILELKSNGLYLAGPGPATNRTSARLPGKAPRDVGLEYRDGNFQITSGALIQRIAFSNNLLHVDSPWKLPPALFGKSPSAGPLVWGPDGFLYFSFRGSTTAESGIGRVAADGTRWDLVCAGMSGESGIQFDRHGRLFLYGATGVLQVPFGTDFRDREWVDQAGPLLNLLPAAGARIRAALVFEGDGLTPAERNGLLVINGGSPAVRQYELTDSGPIPRAHPGRALIQFDVRQSPTDARVGPDGALWLRVEDGGRGRIVHVSRAGLPPRPVNLEALATGELIEVLAHSNSWHRATALKILGTRTDVPNARGLHPTTVLHQWLLQPPDSQTQLEALWAMHQLRLLEDDQIEELYVMQDPWILATVARLVGERAYPTTMAFKALEKLSHHTNPAVRLAVMVACRQMVSGSFVLSRPPPIPIREVFTGGILSGLWFATETDPNPVLNWAYWNAVRPISAFDPVHPMGYFEHEEREPKPLALFTIRRLFNQLAASDDPRKVEDGLAALATWNRHNTVQLRTALQEFRDRLQWLPHPLSEKARESLVALKAKVPDDQVNTLAEEILRSVPVPQRD